MSTTIPVKVERFEYTRRINDNGYNYEITETRFRLVDDRGNIINDNNGKGYISQEYAIDSLFHEEDKNDEVMKRDEYQDIMIPEDYDMDKLRKETEDFNKYVVPLTELEVYRYRLFEKEHRHKDVNKGAIGGGIELHLYPNAIGVGKCVSCGICSEKHDITDYNW